MSNIFDDNQKQEIRYTNSKQTLVLYNPNEQQKEELKQSIFNFFEKQKSKTYTYNQLLKLFNVTKKDIYLEKWLKMEILLMNFQMKNYKTK